MAGIDDVEGKGWKELPGQRLGGLERHDLVAVAVIDGHRNRGRKRLQRHLVQVEKGQGRREQHQPVYLRRVLAGKHRGHQPAQAGADQRPAGRVAEDLLQPRHPLPDVAGKIGRDQVGIEVAEVDRLESLAAAGQAVDEKAIGHRSLLI